MGNDKETASLREKKKSKNLKAEMLKRNETKSKSKIPLCDFAALREKK
jgi:hypothetical protein